MNIKKVHYISGLTTTIFVGLHLFNHCYSILGEDHHIELMTTLRHFYRNIFVETILLLAVATQIYSGQILFKRNRKSAKTFFEKLHIWTGLYLTIFFVIHLCAVFAGRLLLKLDTNFYFGVAGLNNFPANLFFIPYYSLAIVSFFGHISAIHSKKMKQNIFSLTPIVQSKFILFFGIGLAIFILYCLTNSFQGFLIPAEYNILLGK